jgi:hypothetical protein
MATYGDIINIGSPAADSPPEGIQIVQLHNYEQLPTKMDDYGSEVITSDIFSCVGHQWSFRLYPRSRRNTLIVELASELESQIDLAGYVVFLSVGKSPHNRQTPLTQVTRHDTSLTFLH